MHVVAVGGSDAGISAALRARELDPSVEVSVVVADEYPNFSICGIPYLVSGDVYDWRTLAHRSIGDLQAAGLRLLLNTTATGVDVDARRLSVVDADGRESRLNYDELVIGTGATPVRPPIVGLDALGPDDGCSSCTPWATRSLSQSSSTRTTQRPRSSSAPDTSDWRWPKRSPRMECR